MLKRSFPVTISLALAVMAMALAQTTAAQDEPRLRPSTESMTSKADIDPASQLKMGVEKAPLPFGHNRGSLFSGGGQTEAMSNGRYGSWTVSGSSVTHNPTGTAYPARVGSLEFMELVRDQSTANDYMGLIHLLTKSGGDWAISTMNGQMEGMSVFELDLAVYYGVTGQFPNAVMVDEEVMDFYNASGTKSTPAISTIYYIPADGDSYPVDYITQTVVMMFGSWGYTIVVQLPVSDGDSEAFSNTFGAYLSQTTFPFDQIG